MVGTLYVHVADKNRFLLVRSDVGFPHSHFDRISWRFLAIGVEPTTDEAVASLKERGFHQSSLLTER